MRLRPLAVLLLTSAFRASALAAQLPTPARIGCAPPDCASDQVQVTYLGVAGFLIEAGGHVLLTGPSFTNPPLFSVIPRKYGGTSPRLEPDRALIRRLLPAAAARASAILIGHGHYDHLLDVPFIADSVALGAKIYGGPSVRNMLMGDSLLRGRLVAIDSTDVGRFDRMGRWIETDDHAFRIMALRADHSPTVNLGIGEVLYADGTVDAPMQTLPRRAEDWKLGETLAYLIDVLGPDGKTPVFRIYFQDSANSAPLGFPPLELRDRRVDVAILTVPNAQDMKPQAPDGLLWVLYPRYVIAAHWESFFRQQTQPIVVGPASKLELFAASLRRNLGADAQWSFPYPQSILRFPIISR